MATISKLFTDTRITGLLYLGLALTGVFAFVFARSSIYVDGDAVATASNLLEKETLARAAIAVEVIMVGFQALVALWFYKLFRKTSSFAAGMIGVFGTVNAVVMLIASAMWLAALNTAIAGESAATVLSLFNLHELIWVVSGLFFGLWLLPMGYLAFKTKMPQVLAGFLILGGVGYIFSALILILFPAQITLAQIATFSAAVAEFWIVGYLLVKSRLNS